MIRSRTVVGVALLSAVVTLGTASATSLGIDPDTTTTIASVSRHVPDVTQPSPQPAPDPVTVDISGGGSVPVGANLQFTVTLSQANSGANFFVQWFAVGGTARPGVDFTPADGVVVLPPGGVSATFQVTTLINSVANVQDQTVTVHLHSPGSGVEIGVGSATGQILSP